MKRLTFQEKYDAIGRKDALFEGAFITAVKTTEIFCRPTCRARKPKPENVVFYNTVQEALQNGYRACKICKPMEKLGETPVYISEIIEEIHQNSHLRIKDYDLKQRGIDPNQIRRWFKKNHNITFHAYQRMVRINTAYQRIRKGEKVISSAFDSGYESLSGFSESYRSIFGESPTDSNKKQVLHIVRLTTPVGPMFACASKDGICLLEFTDRKMMETEFKDLCKGMNATILPGENIHLNNLQTELQEYFSGNRKKFTVSINALGTKFQMEVWRHLQEIPYGKTHSYKQQAASIGNPNAVRAVASANGKNRISIVIPCHRVIGADGSLTGYGGGIHRKKWLLDLEDRYSKKD